MHLHCSNCC
jgi:hypothetical protein